MSAARAHPVALACAAALLAMACSTQPPGVTDQPSQLVPQGPIYVVAARQKPRIEQSLDEAGLSRIDDALAATYLLRVTVGSDQSFHDCGSFNDVEYTLRRKGQTVLELTAAGWSGSCKPNVFDALSRKLRASFAPPADATSRPPAPATP